ncbi:uncharacterized protein E0L32_002121 [Thyridium curvatum]|uniref:Uncharacterized protein n=1 Tax=Thyridium curvatum TaxID=1093900 RepID=A0A507ARM1_9PEZI|nr:uncharacterized protein E0L32_002012 [Thyridium curvatum]XP_030989229.1 uncharacterized protein E0L32_002121 [Thyridium curvatum]TPX07409.1 hypothetical protein E0L32_002012 [Thyridium curvatum]TPX07518.1 hypothetical protein E0L32_002121 [Thyridium curvatum]
MFFSSTRSSRKLGVFFSLIHASTASLVSTGLSVTLNSIDYYISPFSSGNITVAPSALSTVPKIYGFVPVTVVQDAVARSALPSLFANWTGVDDVFQSGFLGAVFLSGAGGSCISKRNITEGGSTLILPLEAKTIPSGPYFLDSASGLVYPVYRLYDDFSGSFTESLIQTPKGTFHPLSAKISGSASVTIGVPSRIYYTPTAEKPLAGVRIAVKDIFRLAGTKGSNGNRAWYNLYPPSNETGTAMQRLIDAGAQIVGLQKPSQFANGETATADWVDYHSPFNPRGDGYQDPSSSSSGAGASIASYDWLDIAVGSDTGGSIRGPAGVQGLFGNRPSHGLVSLDHAMPLSPTLDTVGYLIRDPMLWDTAQAVLYGSNYKSLVRKTPSYPKKIITAGFPSSNSSAASAKILNGFANALATFVGGSIQTISLADEWMSSKPAEAGSATLMQLQNTTYAVLIAKEQIDLVREPFYKDYAGEFAVKPPLDAPQLLSPTLITAAHDGRLPFVDPAPLARWAYGDSLPASAHDDAIRNKTIFMNWFNDKVLPPVDDPAQCSSGIMLYPASNGGQNPRNQYINAPRPPFGWSSGRISVMSECPDFVFPLGQVASRSAITAHNEYFPVGVDILAAKGCDGMLVKLAQDLVAAEIIAVPKVGGTILGGDILMKRRADAEGIEHLRYID